MVSNIFVTMGFWLILDKPQDKSRDRFLAGLLVVSVDGGSSSFDAEDKKQFTRMESSMNELYSLLLN